MNTHVSLRSAALSVLVGTALVALAACDSGTADETVAVRYAVDEGATVTYTSPDGTETTTADAGWSRTLDVPADATLDLVATSTSGAPVTAKIYVDGELFRADRGQRVHVGGDLDDEAEIEGFIEALGADSLVVLGLTFVVDAETTFEDRIGGPLTFDDFAEGDYVEIDAVALGDGTYRALEIELEDGNDEEEEDDDDDDDDDEEGDDDEGGEEDEDD